MHQGAVAGAPVRPRTARGAAQLQCLQWAGITCLYASASAWVYSVIVSSLTACSPLCLVYCMSGAHVHASRCSFGLLFLAATYVVVSAHSFFWLATGMCRRQAECSIMSVNYAGMVPQATLPCWLARECGVTARPACSCL
ncbi:hypothetical protein COO60DRAFT_388668 [Scenedesmus sp. NREL 46B-D3]|nr:hypothetical protein COO60DRAFT_388668 [Scenedesmus sp. NREL 46B-D3]